MSAQQQALLGGLPKDLYGEVMAVIIDCVKQRHGVTALEELDARMSMTR